jgi:hypothetical protein
LPVRLRAIASCRSGSWRCSEQRETEPPHVGAHLESHDVSHRDLNSPVQAGNQRLAGKVSLGKGGCVPRCEPALGTAWPRQRLPHPEYTPAICVSMKVGQAVGDKDTAVRWSLLVIAMLTCLRAHAKQLASTRIRGPAAAGCRAVNWLLVMHKGEDFSPDLMINAALRILSAWVASSQTTSSATEREADSKEC